MGGYCNGAGGADGVDIGGGGKYGGDLIAAYAGPFVGPLDTSVDIDVTTGSPDRGISPKNIYI